MAYELFRGAIVDSKPIRRLAESLYSIFDSVRNGRLDPMSQTHLALEHCCNLVQGRANERNR